MLKRTALFSSHQKLGAKQIDFGGWEMPVQYTSITDEHLADAIEVLTHRQQGSLSTDLAPKDPYTEKPPVWG